jgi:hypothetical protein
MVDKSESPESVVEVAMNAATFSGSVTATAGFCGALPTLFALFVTTLMILLKTANSTFNLTFGIF